MIICGLCRLQVDKWWKEVDRPTIHLQPSCRGFRNDLALRATYSRDIFGIRTGDETVSWKGERNENYWIFSSIMNPWDELDENVHDFENFQCYDGKCTHLSRHQPTYSSSVQPSITFDGGYALTRIMSDAVRSSRPLRSSLQEGIISYWMKWM